MQQTSACDCPRLSSTQSPAKHQKGNMDKRPSPSQAVVYLMTKMHTSKPLEDEDQSLVGQAKLGCHIAQRMLRVLGTCALRACIKHPLGWPLSQELLCMMMFGILQSRRVSAWRSFFGAVGDLQAWVPVDKQLVVTGSCSSWWVRLRPEERPPNPKATVNWVFFHGGAFVAGHALMYLGSYYYWLRKLAAAGVACSILSVEYPLAPEHPFPAAVEAAAGTITWLMTESGETALYIVGGDSAGGNLTVAALALLRDQGRLSTLPLALTLLSPVVDLSDSSVFARWEPVSSHIDLDGQHPEQHPEQQPELQRHAKEHLNDLQQQQKQKHTQQHQDGTQQQQQQHKQLCHGSHPHSAGGSAGPLQLLKGLAGEVSGAWAAHRSKAGAAAAAAGGWFDYLPGSCVADNLHHYLHDPALLVDPLVSPTFLTSFQGLSQQGMLVVAGGAEVMRPDIAAFAWKVAASGVPVQYHEEENEPHSYAVLAMPHLLKKARVLLQYVEKVACGDS